jgi:hypothetical protein
MPLLCLHSEGYDDFESLSRSDDIIKELCGYVYVTECLELKNCDVLKQGGIQHSLNLRYYILCAGK